MINTATGTFDVEMAPEASEPGGAIARCEFSKTYRGDLEGSSLGVMLTAGDEQAGRAGYVSMEAVTARLGQRTGSFAFQQFGITEDWTQAIECEVVPGSGTAELVGISGRLSFTADAYGIHRYELVYYFVT